MTGDNRMQNSCIKRTILYVYLILYCKLVMVVCGNTCSNKRLGQLPYFNDRKPIVSPLKQVNDFTKMECANLCYSRSSCRSFVFSSDSGECLVYDGTIYSSNFIDHPGMRRYDLVTDNCYDIMKNGGTINGMYTIYPRDDSQPIKVYCDFTSNGGGWLVFQRRTDGSVDFFRSWYHYRDGFGNLQNEFWLGNTNIHRITKQGPYDLRIDLEAFDGSKAYAQYKTFSVASEQDNFRMTLGQYSGNASDTFTMHSGFGFSAKDKGPYINCAISRKSGWWQMGCGLTNLNGFYYHKLVRNCSSIFWYHWTGDCDSLKRTVMKIRPSVEKH